MLPPEPEWTWEQWQWRGTPHSPKLQHCWNPTIRLVRVISRTLIGLTPLQMCSQCILLPQPKGQCVFCLVSLFNGISTFVGDLMPMLFSKRNSSGTFFGRIRGFIPFQGYLPGSERNSATGLRTRLLRFCSPIALTIPPQGHSRCVFCVYACVCVLLCYLLIAHITFLYL